MDKYEMTNVIRKYRSDFGKIYIQVLVDDQNVEFAFDHDPMQAEVDAAVKTMNKTTPVLIIEPMQKLTVETAIAFLKTKYTNVTITGLIAKTVK